jgi:hypothetical protein
MSLTSIATNVASVATLGLAPKIFNGLANLLKQATGGEMDATVIIGAVDGVADDIASRVGSAAVSTATNLATTAVSTVASTASDVASTGLRNLGSFASPTFAQTPPQNPNGHTPT